jgi:Na+-driven multidrug efflux pump
MTNVFNVNYIIGNEIVFWAYLVSMIVIMILTAIFVRKELKRKTKNDNK